MDKITKEQALEAYNLIRKYCTQYHDCADCFFVEEHEESCIFDSGNYNAVTIPCKWQQLDLD